MNTKDLVESNMNINVLFCSNEAYADKMAVTILSLLDHNRDILHRLNIYIRGSELSDSSKKEILRLVNEYGDIRIEFSTGERVENRLSKLRCPLFKGNRVTYYRIFDLEELGDIDRLLYIDSDILIQDSIENLYFTDLEGKLIGVVKEQPTSRSRHNTDKSQEYNCGVLLIDMIQYRELGISDYLSSFSETINLNEWFTGDQTLISLGLGKMDKIYRLPLEYNVVLNLVAFSGAEMYSIRNIKGGYYSPEEIDKAINNPIIVHLISGYFCRVPWLKGGKEPYNSQWHEYLKKTKWCNEFKYSKDNLPWSNLVHFFFGFAESILPRKMYVKLVKNIAKMLHWA